MVNPVMERDRFRCRCCGFDGGTFETWQFLTIDHVVPVSQGGSAEDQENQVAACIGCNRARRAKVFESFDEARDHLVAFHADLKPGGNSTSGLWSNVDVESLEGRCIRRHVSATR